MPDRPVPKVASIPIDLIDVINPRSRSRRLFQEIVDSISAVGLKRPITVAIRRGPTGIRYDLVCGQGRLEAFRELGQTEIPAIVVDAETEDCLVMSLVENVARRQHKALDLLHDMQGMRDRGHTDQDIARKTGLTLQYVRAVLHLLAAGETRLMRAVETGQIPVSVAVEIADAADTEVQRVLQEAYERNILRGQSLLTAKRLVEQRQLRGRKVSPQYTRKGRPLSVDGLLRTYQQDVDKKRMIVRDASTTRHSLLFVVEALKRLMTDDGFVNLLRAEGIETLPKRLAEPAHGGIGGGLTMSQQPRRPISPAFETSGLRVPLDRIIPLRPVTTSTRRRSKYAQISASIAEVGIIEPPIVVRHPTESGKFLLLDGHLRVDIVRTRGAQDVLCLVATDDEAFTYNKRISRLAAVQEHRMILRAVERKVPEARLAKALNIDISTLREKKRALEGICREAVTILSDKPISLSVFRILRRMLPLRQIECAEMMVGMDRYTKTYATALLAATPESQLAADERPRVVKGLSPEQLALMQRETTQLDREIKVAQQTFGADHLRLVLARAYVRKLIANTRVSRYLGQHQPEMLVEFQKIVEADSAAA